MQLTATIETGIRMRASQTRYAETRQAEQSAIREFQPSLERPAAIERPTESRKDRSARGIGPVLMAAAPVSTYNASTFGKITFRRVDERERPKQQMPEQLVADVELQKRLEVLCESLRSRF